MGGGKSSSSSASSSDQSQTALSADGVVTGSVINVSTKGAGNLTITDEFPDSVRDVMGQLISLSSQALGSAMDAGGAALNAAVEASQQAAQPDLTLVKQQSSYIPYILAGAGVVAVVAIMAMGRKR